MDYNLRIPQEKRHLFTDPIDILIAGNREVTIPQVENIFKDYIKSAININFYIVGDIVAKDFFSNNFLKSFIKVCIIDEKTQRNRIHVDFEDFFEEVIEFKNLKGTINKDCWNLFKKVIESKKKTLIKITEGEEDLLVLPLVLQIPIEKDVKNFAFYGQPSITDSKHIIPEGIVIVDVDENSKNKVKEVIAIMERY